MTDLLKREALRLRFDQEEADKSSDEWRFNCGPGALCAALKMTPAELRPHMGDFETKGYTNPTLMLEVLQRLKISHRTMYRSDNPAGTVPEVLHGLLRIQWGGPWTKPGVPMRVRYRKTHWVALTALSDYVFDVNHSDAWLPYRTWATELIPWLIRECVPKADGTWWPTHIISIQPVENKRTL